MVARGSLTFGLAAPLRKNDQEKRKYRSKFKVCGLRNSALTLNLLAVQ
jgi:hypothetical protein